MTGIELGPKSKEALSWMVIAEVLRQSSLDLDIAVLHPGGGQYDTLSLVTEEGNSVLHINRNGVNALASGDLVANIFETAAQSPSKAAARIIKQIELQPANGYSAAKRIRIECAVRIGDFLALNLHSKAHCEWGWADHPEYVGVNGVINSFSIPESWKSESGLFERSSWESRVFLLFKGDAPFASVNISTGEWLDVEGKPTSGYVKSESDDGISRPHVGRRMIFKKDGKVLFDDEVHSSMVRGTRRIYSDEYLVLPEESVLFEFDSTKDDPVLRWNNAEMYFN
jgi:hypothetical protein